MGQISFTANLRRHVSCPPARAEGATVREILDAVFAKNPRLREYVLDEQGRLRRHVLVWVGERPVADRVGLGDRVEATDDVFVFQALSGG